MNAKQRASAVLIGTLVTGWPTPWMSQAIAQSAAPAASEADAAPASAPAAESDAQDRGWPRRFEDQGNVVTIYAPQVDEWPKFDRITFRAVVSIQPKGDEGRVFGILRVSAKTDVAMEERLVILTDRKIEDLTTRDVPPAATLQLQKIIEDAMPAERPQTVSLDRLIAGLDPAKVEVPKVAVSLAPPTIFTSSAPAILVQFMGKPRFKPAPGSSLLFAINTNWDVFLDPVAKQYYLLNDKSWLVTADLDKGPWAAATKLPDSLAQLPPDENWKDVLDAIPGEPAGPLPTVYVAQEPSELIVTDGEPELELVPGTGLMVVANTESDVFYDTAKKQYYFLTAGRWFQASSLAGPWAAASASLPADFQKMPATEEYADVLTAVPGTAAANDAVVMASIPQKATIDRREVTVNVTYDGGLPVFKPIEKTTVQYADNTPYDVFLVDGRYYCCHEAVWFESSVPTYGWKACMRVPPAIYTIPTTSPKHNVTYVTVYESTPTTVVTGYSAGYSGATVAATGVVMFGMGVLLGAALDNDNAHYHYRSSFYSYGCGAVYRGGFGGYVSGGGRYYGPYGGAGHMAAYNPATGRYSRAGGAYGPRGATAYRSAYNPSTGIGMARAGGVSPYGSWGRSAVSNGDRWVSGGYRSSAAGSAGLIRGSEGGALGRAEGRYGNGVTVARDRDGDYYAARDGNVYRRSDDDNWEQTRGSDIQGRTATTSQPPRATRDELRQQAESRSRGEENARRAQQPQQRGSGPRRASPSRGGGGRSSGRR